MRTAISEHFARNGFAYVLIPRTLVRFEYHPVCLYGS